MLDFNKSYAFRISALMAGLLIWTTAGVQADTITQTFTYATISTDWSHAMDIAGIGRLNGTLNSVQIVETVDWAAYLAASNTDSSASVTVKKEQAELQLFDSITGADTPLFDQSIGYNNSTGITLTPSESHVFGNYSNTNSFTYTYTGVAVDPYLGSGVTPFEAHTYTQNDTGTTGGGTLKSTQNVNANLQVQVIYDYTGMILVPEPSAFVLFGIGGLICFGWRYKTSRRRKLSNG